VKSVTFLGALAAAGLGCQAMNTPIYFNGTMPLEVTGQQGDPAVVMDTVALRFRNPTMQERQELDARRAAADPIKVPWISRDHVHVEVSFLVKNLDTEQGQFNFMVDGATEFLKYDETVVSAAITDANQAAVYLPLMQSHPQLLGPGASYTGTLREDDFAEAETDLNAIDQFMAPFASVVINRSDVNPIGMEMLNDYVQAHPGMLVTPAFVEVDVTFTASKHMVAQYLVRVRDDDDQLLHDSGDTRFNPTPAVFTPPPPPP
jgi:hypothetical protein